MKKLRYSITFKMFLITFISIMSIMTIIFVVQSMFFNKFYASTKIDNIIENINSFTKEYKKNNWNYKELSNQINKFQSENNVTLYVNGLSIEEHNYEQNNDLYNMTVLCDNDKYYNMYIDEDVLLKAFDEKIPLRNKSFYLEGVFGDDETIYPEIIDNYKIYVENDDGTDDVLYTDEYFYKGNAVVVDMNNVMDNIIDDIEIIEGESDILIGEIGEIGKIVEMEKTMIHKKNGVSYGINEMPFVNIKEVNFFKSIELEKGKTRFIEVNASLQPVGEALNIIDDYYILFYLFAIIISLLIALIYSKQVSKPLLELTSVADKMAGMDFSVKADIDRDDELGILSNSLNVLSSNLDEAVTNLKEANKQLILDMEKEKKQENIRKEFIANVSHELKTPLGIIKGFAEGIKDGIKKEKVEYYLDVILDETDRINALIYDMLELSKIEAKKIQTKEEFYIKVLIKEIVEIFSIQLNNKGLKIEIAGEFNKVYAVKLQIKQVIINLLSNAVKYCVDKTVIKITGEIKGEYNYVYIHNVGNQLSKEELENIWLRFYKIDKSRNRESGGTGLGLAIVKAILEAHDSDYGVINEDDGVTFYFSMKLTDINY